MGNVKSCKAMTEAELLALPLSFMEAALAAEEAAFLAVREELEAIQAQQKEIKRRKTAAKKAAEKLDLEAAEEAVRARAKALAVRLWEDGGDGRLLPWLRRRKAALVEHIRAARENARRLEGGKATVLPERERLEALHWTHEILRRYDR